MTNPWRIQKWEVLAICVVRLQIEPPSSPSIGAPLRQTCTFKINLDSKYEHSSVMASGPDSRPRVFGSSFLSVSISDCRHIRPSLWCGGRGHTLKNPSDGVTAWWSTLAKPVCFCDCLALLFACIYLYALLSNFKQYH